MISILESVSALERSYKARKTVLECYLGSLRGAARYAINLDSGISRAYQTDLESLAHELERAQDHVLAASTPRLLEIFKRFRDQSTDYVSNLRADMVKSAEALETIVRGLAENDGEQDARVRASLASVRDISELPECASIKAALLSAAQAIESSVDQIRNQHQLTVAQLKSEIRVLHKRVDRAENVVAAEDVKQLTTADGIATACMVMGKDKAVNFIHEHPEFKAFFVFSDEKGTFRTWLSPELQEMISDIQDN
jgi:hypothetical protein